MSKQFTQLTPFFWTTQSSAYAATNSGIIIDNGEAALIDPAVRPDEIEAIAAFVRDQGATVSTILVTHGHWDHVLGPAHFPDAQVVTQLMYEKIVEEHAKGLHASLADWEREAGIVRSSPFVVPQPDTIFEQTLLIKVGREAFQLSHAPGHHLDMYVVYHPRRALLWAADMLSDLEIPFVEQHLGDYRKTLAMLKELDVEILIPGHGNWTDEPDEIEARLTRDQAYLAALDETVRACLAEGLDVAQTMERCAGIVIHHPEQNGSAHRDNVEWAWLELGGKGDSSALGWGKYY